MKYAFKAQQHQLTLLVVSGSGPSLLGRDWMKIVTLDWKSFELFHVRSTDVRLNDVLNRHEAAFKDELGVVSDTTAKIHADPQSRPPFCNPRPVPYALRSKVEQELERLENAGVIEPVEFSEWAAPIVPVVKRDGSIRVCGDYKVTINQAANLPAAENRTFSHNCRMENLLRSLISLTHTSNCYSTTIRNSIQPSTRTRGCIATTAFRSVSIPHPLFSNGPWREYCEASRMSLFTLMIFSLQAKLKTSTSRILMKS